MKNYTPKTTPVERDGDILLKRDDLYCFNGIRGGKVRSCLAIARKSPGTGLITAGARHSPQMQIVARVGAALGVPVRCHTAAGTETPEMADARKQGAVVVAHRPGYNSVICARAEEDWRGQGAHNWTYIPFGMECREAVRSNARQAKELPIGEFDRIVVVIGSGMTVAGILWGLYEAGLNIPVLGVRIGADPSKRLGHWAPPGWRAMLRVVTAPHPYHAAIDATIGGVRLDAHYEAKVVEYLKPRDLFWIVGIRAN